LDWAKIFEDTENVWVETGGLHWLDAKNGKIVREGAVSALGFAKLNGSVFVAAREPAGVVPPDCCGDVQNASVYEVKGRKGTLLPYKISDPFYDGRTDQEKENTSFYQTVWPFGRHLIFSGMRTRYYRVEDGEMAWEKQGQYKAQISRTVFTITGGDVYVLRRCDIENDREEILATYPEEDLFGRQ
jgi:hypothetical protein